MEGTELARDARAHLFDQSSDPEFGERLLAAALAEDPGSLHALETLERLLLKRLQWAIEQTDWEYAELQVQMLAAAIEGATAACRSTQQVRHVHSYVETTVRWRDTISSGMNRAGARWLDEIEPQVATAEGEELAELEDVCTNRQGDVSDPTLLKRLAQVLVAVRDRQRHLEQLVVRKQLDELARRGAEASNVAETAALLNEVAQLIARTSTLPPGAAESTADASFHSDLLSLEKKLQESLASKTSQEMEAAADARSARAINDFRQLWKRIQTNKSNQSLTWQSVLDDLALADRALAGVEVGCSRNVLDEVQGYKRQVIDLAAEARAKQFRNYNQWAIGVISNVHNACAKAVDDKSGSEEDDALVLELSKLGEIDQALLHSSVMSLYNDVYSKWINEDLPIEKKLEVATNIVKANKHPLSAK